jgi:hypothetical protein
MFPHNQLRRRGVMKNRLGQFFIVAVVAAFMVATGTAMAAIPSNWALPGLTVETLPLMVSLPSRPLNWW